MKKLLVVIDMQNDFVTGTLGTKEACNIAGKVRDKIQSCMELGHEVVFTRDTHDETYSDTQEGRILPVGHCMKGSDGWELIPEIRSLAAGKKIFDKPAFGSIRLAEYIQEKGFEEVELIGVCTDICVVSNALLIKAYVPEVPVYVDSSCCAGVTLESHNSALSTMKMCQIFIK